MEFFQSSLLKRNGNAKTIRVVLCWALFGRIWPLLWSKSSPGWRQRKEQLQGQFFSAET
ncbi:hypothetical protein RHMOL_Rhmol03G0273200 [Rhododendron molle]|uniref:Uncharacterized protein n=1 Tax=Rhododendron molle TaxID=49168 RepID=A0ACC0PKP5_RHOML|nr:hypothetical protein RHMOL_Rhmol03G0273200 [Rhododendron molle]